LTEVTLPQPLDSSMNRRAILKSSAALGVGALIAGHVGPAAAQDATPAAADVGEYPELVIVASEFMFELPATAESGYTRLTLDNQGGADHHAMFFRLNDDTTEEQFMTGLQSGDLGALLAFGASYGGPMAGAGSQESVIASLDAGTYAVICLIPDEQGVPHVALGMLAMLEVSEGANTAPDPVADGTITLVEMAFEGLPSELPAGAYTWQVINGGTQLHEMAILQLAPGVPAEALIAAMTAGPPEAAASPDAVPAASPVADAGPPPFVGLFGAAPMSPGATNYVEFDAQPGEYVAVCFIPDAETGVPHAVMGMVASFTVV